MDPCGCATNSNDPNAPLTPPEGTAHAYGSINCPSTPKPCYTPLCNDSFQSLPIAKRIDLVGVSGKCMYRLDTSKPGFAFTDGKGGFAVSNEPVVDLPQYVAYAQGTNGLVLDASKNPIESEPPEFPYLVIQLADGSWRKVRGRPGSIGLVVWDDDGFHIKDVDDSNILISRPTDEAEQIELIGFDTEDCLEEGERNNLVRLVAGFEGVAFFNPTTGKFTITSICELFTDIGSLTGVPFLLACSDGNPIRFKGTSPSVLIWDTAEGAFKLVAVDDKACDPTCGCSTELTLLYDCTTNQWTVGEPETHILVFKNFSDTGPNASVDFTLPWPALVTVYASRRFIPVAGSLDVHKCDIIIDGLIATSPSDGGMVARLDQATTSLGVAVVPVKKGGHNAYIGNGSTTDDVVPQWSGAWIKVVAHKISDCDPLRPIVGGGTIRKAFGDTGEECDCPPGPGGAPGEQGPQGIQGIQGPAGGGAGCTPGDATAVGDVFTGPDEGNGTISLYYTDVKFGIELDEDEESCSWFQEPVAEDHLIAQVQKPIANFTMGFVADIFISSGQYSVIRKNLNFVNGVFTITDGSNTTNVGIGCDCD